MRLKSLTSRRGGFSLLEANMAVALSLMTLAGCFAANANFLAVLKSSNQAASASQSVQERVEQMRIANWLQITDPNYVKTNLIGSATASARSLPNCTETLTLSAYPEPVSGGSTPTKLTRTGGEVTVISTNPSLKSTAMVKAEWTLAWKPSAAGPARSRTGTVLVAKGGIVK